MIFIEESKQEYENNFPALWIEKYDWNDELSSKNSYETSMRKLKGFTEIFFLSFCKSILSGEYIKNRSKVQTSFDDIEDLIIHEYEDPTNLEPNRINQFKVATYDKYKKLDSDIRVCITHYRALCDLVNDKINFSSQDSLFNTFSVKGVIDSSGLLIKIVQHVIPLCFLDHVLSNEKENIKNLILRRDAIKKELEKNKKNNIIEPVFQILYEKCSFLLKKIIHFSGRSEYSLDFKKYSLTDQDIRLGILSPFDEKFNFLDQGQYDERKISQYQDHIQDKKERVSDIILLMKYYQKDNGTIEQINNLLKIFEERYRFLFSRVKERPFDNLALRTTKNYLYNCRFSFKLGLDSYSFEELKKDMAEIRNIQVETRIKNFFPYLKAVKYLINTVSLEFEGNSNDKEVALKEKLDLLDSYMDVLKSNLDWCRNQSFYPFQLIYEECTAFYTRLRCHIFIPSSFSRPIDYNTLYEHFSELKLEVVALRNRLSLLKDIQVVGELKKGIAESERKYIEYMGIYTAAITFLFGTIDFFSKAKETQLLIKSSFALGFILLLFVSAIYFMRLPEIKKPSDLLQPKFIFFIVTTIAYLIILYKTSICL